LLLRALSLFLSILKEPYCATDNYDKERDEGGEYGLGDGRLLDCEHFIYLVGAEQDEEYEKYAKVFAVDGHGPLLPFLCQLIR
jgi:hypothetical protein